MITLRSVRELGAPWLLAAIVGALLLIGATAEFAMRSDYLHAFWPAYERLQAGDLHGFRQHLGTEATYMTLFGAAPAYIAGKLGLAEVGTARFVGVLPLIAFAGLAGYLGGEARAAGRRWWPAVVLLALYPLAKDAIRYGHSEDLLAASAAVGAVLVALHDRPKLAGLLLVVAIIAKPWAVLAIGPAALAAPRRPLLLLGIALIGGAAAVKLGTLFVEPARGGLTSAGGLLHAQSIWWPAAPGPRIYPSEPLSNAVAPDWMGIAHPLIVLLAVPLSLGWLWVSRTQRRPLEEALLLLALLFLLRCLLDPWNNTYYHLPLVVTLLAWDVRNDRFPWLALGVSACVLISCELVGTRTGWLAFGLYVAWAVPLVVALGWRVYGRPHALGRRYSAALRPAPT